MGRPGRGKTQFRQQQLGRGPHSENELTECHTVCKGQSPSPHSCQPQPLSCRMRQAHRTVLSLSHTPDIPRNPWSEGDTLSWAPCSCSRSSPAVCGFYLVGSRRVRRKHLCSSMRTLPCKLCVSVGACRLWGRGAMGDGWLCHIADISRKLRANCED